MAAYLDVTYQGQPSRFARAIIDRKRLHGYTKRVALDADGHECTTAHLTRDGRFLLAAGSTADTYINKEGDSVPRTDLVQIGCDDRMLAAQSSRTGESQEAEGPVPVDELLDCVVVKAHALTPESLAPALQSALSRGAFLRLPFRPRNANQPGIAFLLANDHGLFLLQAEPCGFEPVGPEQAATELDPWDDDHDEEFDFDNVGRWER